MRKTATIKIGAGDFERGFAVSLRVEARRDEASTELLAELDGRLPPAPDLPRLYRVWKEAYSNFSVDRYRKLEPLLDGETTHVSVRDSAVALETYLDEWLEAPDRNWRALREELFDRLDRQDEIQFFIRTVRPTALQERSTLLWQLPWHLCSLFQRYPRADVALDVAARTEAVPPSSWKERTRILAILGEATDIQVQADLVLLRDKLSENSVLEAAIATNRQKVCEALWQQEPDILFFAGHSTSGAGSNAGRFYLSETESLSVEDLKYALRRAVAQGLKLAIFNSCDGLALARDLADLQIPAVVVMRERVPDEAAQHFLEYFLEAFVRDGKSLSTSVREARERLHGWEGKYPCASWLPVLCQHPSADPLNWETLRETSPTPVSAAASPSRRLPWKRWQRVAAASLVAVGLVGGARSLGWLMAWELPAFDRLLQLRADEGPDPRLLLVGITEDDLQQYGFPLPDDVLADAIERLQPHQPVAIGLYLLRDLPEPPGTERMERLWQKPDLIGTCTYATPSEPANVPPPEPASDERVGFSNLLLDVDGVQRRILLSRTHNLGERFDPCRTPYSLSLQLAAAYLQKNGVSISFAASDDWQFGDRVLHRLNGRSGSYQNIDARGHQVLFSYRRTKTIAQAVSVRDLLEGRFEPSWIAGKIVIIGTVAESVSTSTSTPVGNLSGLHLQAQAVSQILSAIENDRAPIRSLPEGVEWLWIGFWALAGGAIASGFRRSAPRRYGALSCTLLFLSFSCWSACIYNGWLPLVSPAIAIAIAAGSVRLLEPSDERS